MSRSAQQLDTLTAARGLAAWMVVLFHLRGGMPWLPEGVQPLLAKGYLAVDFFFLLSGFVIHLSSREAFRAKGLAAMPRFLARRAARIYPLYATVLAATVAFVLLLEATDRSTEGYPWQELPLHMAMLQNWGFTHALTWNHPAWSISAELGAYLVYPAIALALLRKRLPTHALPWIGTALIGGMAAALHAGGASTLGEDIPRFGLLRCLCEFAAGAVLCELWLRGPVRGYPAIAIGAAAALWTAAPAAEPVAFPIIAGSAILLVADLACAGTRVPRWLTYPGEISYATYLSHFMLFVWFKIALVDDPADISPGLIALFLLLVLAASVALHHGIEKPGRRIAYRRDDPSLQVPTAAP